jgi:hypothetical protein
MELTPDRMNALVLAEVRQRLNERDDFGAALVFVINLIEDDFSLTGSDIQAIRDMIEKAYGAYWPTGNLK